MKKQYDTKENIKSTLPIKITLNIKGMPKAAPTNVFKKTPV